MTQESQARRAEKHSKGLSVLTRQFVQKKLTGGCLTRGDRALLYEQNFSGSPGSLLSCLALRVLCLLSRVNTPNSSTLAPSVVFSQPLVFASFPIFSTFGVLRSFSAGQLLHQTFLIAHVCIRFIVIKCTMLLLPLSNIPHNLSHLSRYSEF